MLSMVTLLGNKKRFLGVGEIGKFFRKFVCTGGAVVYKSFTKVRIDHSL